MERNRGEGEEGAEVACCGAGGEAGGRGMRWQVGARMIMGPSYGQACGRGGG